MMVVGGGGDGKSSFIDRLTGKNINPDHIPTNALNAEISCKVNITKVSQAWVKIEVGKLETLETDLAIGLTNAMEGISDSDRQDLLKEIDTTQAELRSSTNDLSSGVTASTSNPIANIASPFTKPKTLEPSDNFEINYVRKEDDDEVKNIPEETEALKRSRDIKGLQQLKELAKKQLDKDDRSIIYVWDFGGQLVYYSIHQVFLRGKCVYVLVIKLTTPLDQNMLALEGTQNSSGKESQTYFERIEFWLNLILSHMKKKKGKNLGKGCVVVVGTHKDLLHPDPEQQNILADQYFKNLKERLRNKQHKHLIRSYFKVDSKGGDSETYELIREELLDAIKIHCNWGKKRPIKWLLLEKHLHELQNDGGIPEMDKKLVKLQDVQKYASLYDIHTKEDVQVFLEFSHLCGDLTYLPTPELKNYVIPNPQWLCNVFRAVINMEGFFPVDTEIEESLDRLKKEGRLERHTSLLPTIWKDVVKTTDKNEEQEIIKFLLNLMIEFDLAVSHSDKICFVPNMLPYSPGYSEDLYPDMVQCATALYFRFHSSRDSHEDFLEGSTLYDQFLPYGIFQRLISRCVKLGWSWAEHKYRDLVSYSNEDCKIILSSQSAWIKLEILISCNPVANIAVDLDKYRNTLAREIDNLVDTYNQNMWYEYCVNPCKNNEPQCLVSTGKSSLGGDLKLARCSVHRCHMETAKICLWFKPGRCRMIKQRDLVALSQEVTDYSTRLELGIELEVELSDIEATRTDNPEIRMATIEMLEYWYNREGHKPDAFLTLCNALKKVGLDSLIPKCLKVDCY